MVRYTYLDLVRGIAALAVLVFHFHGFQPAGQVEQLPWSAFLWPFYEFGGYAVQVFWLLSGIVFLTVYGQQPVSGREFFLRRFARLYPLHFATLLAMLVLDQVNRAQSSAPLLPANDPQHFMLQLFMASNWWEETVHSFNAPIWSVSMEVLAYAAFFAALRWGWTTLPRLSLIAAIATALALWTARYTITCVALFFIGTAVAHLPRVLERWHAPVAAVGLAGALVLAVLVGSSSLSRHVGIVLTYAVFPFMLLGVLVVDLRAPPVPKRLRWIGESTYAVYLLHIPVQTAMLLTMKAVGLPVPASEAWLLVLYALTVIALAKVVYQRFELPAQRSILAWHPPGAAVPDIRAPR